MKIRSTQIKYLIFLIIIAFGITSCSNMKMLSNPNTSNQTTLSNSTENEGSSYENAVIINEQSESSGVAAEYAWLRDHYPGYKSKMQSLNFYKKRPYDIIIILTQQGEEKSVYFDISHFYGKL